MVLSNKKLKQQLRAAKAELIADAVAQNRPNIKDSSKETGVEKATNQDTILNAKSWMSKREKRRQKAVSSVGENYEVKEHKEIGGEVELKEKAEPKPRDVEMKEEAVPEHSDVELKEETEPKAHDDVELKKKRKRKRDEGEAIKTAEESREEMKRRRKKGKRRIAIKKLRERKRLKKETSEGKSNEASEYQVLPEVTKESESGKDVEVANKVYVGGIPYYSNEDDIRSFFEGCGTITEVDCMRFPETGKFRGIAILTFKTEAAAKRAIALDGSDMGGLFLKIQQFKTARVEKNRAEKIPTFSPSIVEGYNRVYAGNLAWDITEDDLRKFFSGCMITSIRFGEDKETKEFKGYAHVDFADSVSLNTALKLDQSVVCGRPVKISYAVPLKGKAVITSKSAPTKDGQAESIKVSSFSENQVDNAQATEVYESQVDENMVNPVSSKVRRRTCYECGERGHLSSDCPNPQKQAPEAAGPGKDDQVNNAQISTVYKNHVSAVYENHNNLVSVNQVSSKIRRRTCYECGERGHLSSDCPNPKKQAVEDASMAKDDRVEAGKVSTFVENPVESDKVSSKIRRRTCYECGERGHLSSDCPNPKKQAREPASLANDEQVNDGGVCQVYETQVDKNLVTPVSSKIKRRNCYECGERGHLSSACPNPKKQVLEPAALAV